MTLIEIAVAMGMLAVLLGGSAQVLRTFAKQRQAADQRATALRTIEAVSEELSNVPWDELTAEVASRWPVPAGGELPGGRLTVKMVDEREPVTARRVTVALTWSGAGGAQAGVVRLTTWIFPDDEERG